jgi:hypothetical protein
MLRSCFALAWPAAEHPVGAGSGGFGGGSGFAAPTAQLGGHPGVGSERAFHQSRKPQVNVELGEVKIVAGRADLDCGELCGCGLVQSLRSLGGERQLITGAQFDDDLPALAVKVGGKGAWIARRLLARLFARSIS